MDGFFRVVMEDGGQIMGRLMGDDVGGTSFWGVAQVGKIIVHNFLHMLGKMGFTFIWSILFSFILSIYIGSSIHL